MDAIVKALGRFVTRDALYIVGGALVLASAGQCFSWVDVPRVGDPRWKDVPVILWLFAAAISYVIGYVIRELTRVFFKSLDPPVNILPSKNGRNKRLKCLYRWFSGDDYPNINEKPIDYMLMKAMVSGENCREHIERTGHIHHIGAIMGPNCFVAGVFVLCISCKVWPPNAILHNPCVGLALIFWGVILCFFSCMKAMEETYFVMLAPKAKKVIKSKPKE